jgi:phosphoglycerol transferase
MPFPEPGGPLVNMTDYEPFRGYLHSTALRWSYGAQKGREIDAWQQQVASLPAAALVAEAQRAGFSAVWVDRNGYADNGAAIEAALAQATGVQPIVSDDGQLSVFVLKAR